MSVNTSNLLIKKLHVNAVIPSYASLHSAGCDLYAVLDEAIILKPSKTCVVPTGLAIAIADGYEVQIRSRSGLAAKNGIFVLNSPGTIDSDYRGELKIILANFSDTDFVVESGMRIAQMVLASYTKANFIETQNLDQTARGEGGFGSSGV